MRSRGGLSSDDLQFWDGLYEQRDHLGVVDLATKVEARTVSSLLGS
jgi:hypothetical protein